MIHESLSETVHSVVGVSRGTPAEVSWMCLKDLCPDKLAYKYEQSVKARWKAVWGETALSTSVAASVVIVLIGVPLLS